MTACSSSNTRKSIKFLSATTLEYTLNPISYPSASDCTNKTNGTRTAYSFNFNYSTSPTYTVSNQSGQTGLIANYGTWTVSGSDTPSYYMLIYPKDQNEFWIGFGTSESNAKAITMLYGGGDGGAFDNKYTK